MNRINPALFSAAFTTWVRETWPGQPEFVATCGKTSRRSHDRAEGAAPLHLVSAFATTSRPCTRFARAPSGGSLRDRARS